MQDEIQHIIPISDFSDFIYSCHHSLDFIVQLKRFLSSLFLMLGSVLFLVALVARSTLGLLSDFFGSILGLLLDLKGLVGSTLGLFFDSESVGSVLGLLLDLESLGSTLRLLSDPEFFDSTLGLLLERE